MSPVVTAIVVGIMTTLAKWSRDKPLSIDVVVGVVVLALTLSLIEQGNEKLARAFGALVVIAVALVHAPIVLDATGLTKLKAGE